MKLGVHLTGNFGQSDNLYRKRNEWKRGRGSYEEVEKQIDQDTLEIVKTQRNANLDFVIDPMFNSYYLFQAFAERVKGVNVGPQENWFNNNVFYWRPQINGPLELQQGFSENFLRYKPKGESIVVLPSPYSLFELSDIKGYRNDEDAIENLSRIIKAEAKQLASLGFVRVQYDEPAIVVRQSLNSLREKDLKLLERAMNICGRIDGVSTSLHTYFGDAGPIIPRLLKLPVDCIGIDCTETSIDEIVKNDFSNKELSLGLLDARNTSLEGVEDIVEQIKFVEKETNPKRLWLTPNTGTEYRGYSHGLKKLELLGRIKERYNE